MAKMVSESESLRPVLPLSFDIGCHFDNIRMTKQGLDILVSTVDKMKSPSEVPAVQTRAVRGKRTPRVGKGKPLPLIRKKQRDEKKHEEYTCHIWNLLSERDSHDQHRSDCYLQGHERTLETGELDFLPWEPPLEIDFLLRGRSLKESQRDVKCTWSDSMRDPMERIALEFIKPLSRNNTGDSLVRRGILAQRELEHCIDPSVSSEELVMIAFSLQSPILTFRAFQRGISWRTLWVNIPCFQIFALQLISPSSWEAMFWGLFGLVCCFARGMRLASMCRDRTVQRVCYEITTGLKTEIRPFFIQFFKNLEMCVVSVITEYRKKDNS